MFLKKFKNYKHVLFYIINYYKSFIILYNKMDKRFCGTFADIFNFIEKSFYKIVLCVNIISF